MNTLLLHGFLGSGRNLRSLAAAWSERSPARRIFLPDLTGHGQSPPLRAGADLHTLARDVLAMLDEEAPGAAAHWIGHSLGGRVALAASLLAPERVASLTLLDISPAPLGPESTGVTRVLQVLLAAPDRATNRKAMREALQDEGLPLTVAEWLVTNLAPEGDGMRWRIDRQALAALHARAGEPDLWPAIEGRATAARCIRGGRSPFVSEAAAARMEAAGCPVITLERAGHDVHVEAPAELLAALVAGGPRFGEAPELD